MTDSEPFFAQYDRHRQARSELGASNKNAVLAALAAGDITYVLVEFDGVGDSGQIESVTALRDEERVEFPSVSIALRQLAWGASNPSTVELSLQAAVETLCYDYLEMTHDGWENNDGAYGAFRLDVGARTVQLEFNGRFTDTFTTDHTF
jgi:hypothetical protein